MRGVDHLLPPVSPHLDPLAVPASPRGGWGAASSAAAAAGAESPTPPLCASADEAAARRRILQLEAELSRVSGERDDLGRDVEALCARLGGCDNNADNNGSSSSAAASTLAIAGAALPAAFGGSRVFRESVASLTEELRHARAAMRAAALERDALRDDYAAAVVAKLDAKRAWRDQAARAAELERELRFFQDSAGAAFAARDAAAFEARAAREELARARAGESGAGAGGGDVGVGGGGGAKTGPIAVAAAATAAAAAAATAPAYGPSPSKASFASGASLEAAVRLNSGGTTATAAGNASLQGCMQEELEQQQRRALEADEALAACRRELASLRTALEAAREAARAGQAAAREERDRLQRRVHEQEQALGEARSALARTTTDLVASQAALKESQTAGARMAAAAAAASAAGAKGGRRSGAGGGGGEQGSDGAQDDDGGGGGGDGGGDGDDDEVRAALRDKLARAERALDEASRAKLRALAQAGEAARAQAEDRAELDALRAKLAAATAAAAAAAR